MGKLTIGLIIFAASAVISMVAVVVFLVSLPEDHFCHADDAAASMRRRTPLTSVAIVLKNLLGILLVIIGIVLSIPGVPGQGLLTILLGLMLLDVPGKHRVELWILHRRGVIESINRLRARFDREPLQFDA